MKIIDKTKLTPKERKLLTIEISIAKSLKNKNIIAFHEVIESSLYVYIVMEHLYHGELYTYLKTRKSFNEHEVVSIIFQLIKGVEYIHSMGIIHRDLKPENIMIELNHYRDRVVSIKIIDFGLSCVYIPREIITDSCGTPAYVAPEVIRREPYDYSVDMWSVGIITYLL